ncbi:5-amino-6-(5-phospho-D-ribitylamino)uracil phosphatase, chloroplastic-like [Hordeum vulgare subsp. vulgare]|uniref:5-amino-6-(5-phospho-D-ribitylamino)uracil phosphatase, chloroplastic-like n=1 Tax=Hordeum vulgare subsp. vulgare TaxID=112509 RepID=UPI001D1A3AF6|nr:5-amino-6-(5-phospho-D-ribitylamino)uracil phosphatase, chloroplastic-like [Hordeum vulgare subsp. vulgare]
MMMVDTVSASTSFIAHHPFDHHRPKGIHARRTLHVVSCRHLGTAFAGRRLVARVVPMRQPARRLADWPGRALAAVGFTKEAVPRKEFRGIPGEGDTGGLGTDDAPPAATPSWPPQNRADDPSLHNPLMRLERMGCGWVGVIFEWEGMVVEDDTRLERQAWLTLAEEEGKSPPPAFILRRVEGMKAEHAVPEVLCWSRDPSELRRLPRGRPWSRAASGTRSRARPRRATTLWWRRVPCHAPWWWWRRGRAARPPPMRTRTWAPALCGWRCWRSA